MSDSPLKLYDVTLRDGNHALRHGETTELVKDYCELADQSGVWCVEVGHGNGIGASSALVGFSRETDEALLSTARDALQNTKLGVHSIPGFSIVKRDILPAIELGVDVVRIGTHVTEADVSAKHVAAVREAGATAISVFMMSHMASIERLVEECLKAESYGTNGIVLMDSAGHFTPKDVRERIAAIRGAVGVEVGFHAHNNLGVAIANDLVAIDEGATIIDASTIALGAGAGNAQLECLVPVLENEIEGFSVEHPAIFFAMSQLIQDRAADYLPSTTSSSVVSAIAGVFSGYAPQVKAISEEMNIDAARLWRELGSRRIVAGQESIIREIALDLMELSS
jgi:4-hydroxy 2-oxovalerate aldolase